MKYMLLLFAGTLSAQTPTTFEVASIKSNTSGSGSSSIHFSTGRITMENVHLKKVTLWAYGIPDDREYALAGPDWLTTKRFDIQATFPADTQVQQVHQMMQALLAARFKLALHRETRQMPIYALVAAKNGPKVGATEDGQARTSGGLGRIEATRVSMQKLADLLAGITGREVLDETGLKGVFNFTLEWAPDETQKNAPPGDGGLAGASGPSIYSALQEQLGLRLEGRKGPLEVLVVDHMEKAPTAN